jgi:V8-like Glu-specific endopeptidase
MSEMSRALTRPRAVLTVLGVALAVTIAPAAAARAGSGQVVTTVAAGDRAAALSYWTPERIKQQGEFDGLPPAEQIGKVWPGPVPAGVGRLFFTAVPGGDESCTATVVPSPGQDVVFTAGHCLDGGTDRHDRPIKMTNMVFVPGYDHGKQPHGMFAARAFAWSGTYQGPSSALDDDGVIALDPAGGKHVAEVAGTQDISFDQVTGPVDTTMLGYPVSRLAHGEALVSCTRPATLDTNSVTADWTTDCDLAGGASGGPWLRNFDPATGKGTIYAVTSRGSMNVDGVTENLSGAELSDAVRALYQRAGEL